MKDWTILQTVETARTGEELKVINGKLKGTFGNVIFTDLEGNIVTFKPLNPNPPGSTVIYSVPVTDCKFIREQS